MGGVVLSPNDSAGVVVAARNGRWRQRCMRLALGREGSWGCFRNRIQTPQKRVSGPRDVVDWNRMGGPMAA